ncbi:hypothetical protein VB774_19985 [Pseudanabaena galeata UHCC 0370]|uniref:EF-hand domain-containing protein n=1 Tax=Pseudanabaena galeata UHCC 0370 TaxID=3110310 RepID=A0ABU5TPL2_9CYAN|nr:hypothetical protein [Pseudanabaena galeata]MEA5479913.1 hypothetical protein [Pseudanabaena galeata UHCC 0370]
MVFIQSSEASQANAQQLAIAQTTIEALAELLRQLLAKQEELLPNSEGNKQQSESPSSGFSDAEWDRVFQQWDQDIADDWWRRYQAAPDRSAKSENSQALTVTLSNPRDKGEPDFAMLPNSPIQPSPLSGSNLPPLPQSSQSLLPVPVEQNYIDVDWRELPKIELSELLRRDLDGDGITDVDELRMGLNPRSIDTDGDGISDRDELGHSNPLSFDDFRQQVMAAVSVALVAKLGVDGKYEAENYCIQSQDNFYEISNLDGEAIAKFKLQSDRAVFTEDWTTLDQQIDFTKTAFRTTTVDIASLTQNQGYLAAVDKLGDLAPAGARGVVVVESVLNETGQEYFKGGYYDFQRNEDGDIAIFNNHTGEDILRTTQGQISLNAMTPTDLNNFQQAFQRMNSPQPMLEQSSPDLER